VDNSTNYCKQEEVQEKAIALEDDVPLVEVEVISS
jgi:hypothetical protein